MTRARLTPGAVMLLDRIGRKVGTGIPPTRRKTVLSALTALAQRRGLDDIASLYERMDTDRRLTDEIIARVTVGESYFFRHPEHFELIRTMILPRLMSEGGSRAEVSAWSAGCATGEEPYSLAIVMEEEGLGERSRILASDISGHALKAAEKAEYGEWSLRNAEPSLLSRFASRGNSFRLHSGLAGRVEFIRHTLGGVEAPPQPARGRGFDLILCRNVLMYLDEAELRQAAAQLFDSLAEGGWLLTSASDPPLWDLTSFETEATAAGVVYRRPGAAPVPGGNPAEAATEAGARDTAGLPLSHPGKPLHALEPQVIAGRIAMLLETGGTTAAMATAAVATEQYPFSTELHYLHGLSLQATGRLDEAVSAFRQALALDGTLEAAHFRIGALLTVRDPGAALRELASALALCAARAPAETVPLMGATTAAAFAELTTAEISRLEPREGYARP